MSFLMNFALSARGKCTVNGPFSIFIFNFAFLIANLCFTFALHCDTKNESGIALITMLEFV
jgi:hypothetical protein